MNTTYSLLVTILAAGLMAGAAHAADAARGAQLHSQQCTGCHAARFGGDGSGIYTRDNRRVRSLPGLQQQVNRCKNNLQIVWFDEDVDDVVDHLNASYYHFSGE
jgi:hypothetical protein